MIHADDDPFISAKEIPWTAITSGNKNIIASITNRGGHVGWIEGFTPFNSAWHDSVRTSCM